MLITGGDRYNLIAYKIAAPDTIATMPRFEDYDKILVNNFPIVYSDNVKILSCKERLLWPEYVKLIDASYHKICHRLIKHGVKVYV